ncbi:MAG: ThuA domain-containing protein [candidate division KSB1 bacterium]|nr:ThuA domain-containing protein [candidate division KSB1 bacterium]MDZ7335944.1 ThuA domain-containing protein [candidate division KSB1 bacterium]MDZ7357738.1 ThuA domain-containing protein [candidate division KSB1 bacterium]MDZ7376965.1 ThuA domain-containing protein [candidate division KSB1 bacterium]MDZ7399865.1 ThuA domain-containing protein [candidate division KSB1 bacterium]
MTKKIHVTIWNEFIHERQDENVRKIYPNGMHQTIAGFLSAHEDIAVKTATLDQLEHGLSEAILNQTDVLIWWGHKVHQQVSDEVARRVQRRVLEGMGLIVLHSAHYSKIFKALMGTNCSLRWREIGEKERLWNIAPGHPITQGIGDYIEIPHSEMYGERFDIPEPDKVIFISWFQGGEVFRSGCCWERGHGQIFYFSPGHETYPIYHQPEIQRVITNAVRWARPQVMIQDKCPMVEPLEKIGNLPLSG